MQQNVIKVEWDDIPFKKSSGTPFLTHCRRLLRDGAAPDSRVEFWDKGKLRMFTNNLGEAAKWTVQEEPNIRFVKYDAPVFKNTSPQPTTPPT